MLGENGMMHKIKLRKFDNKIKKISSYVFNRTKLVVKTERSTI